MRDEFSPTACDDERAFVVSLRKSNKSKPRKFSFLMALGDDNDDTFVIHCRIKKGIVGDIHIKKVDKQCFLMCTDVYYDAE